MRHPRLLPAVAAAVVLGTVTGPSYATVADGALWAAWPAASLSPLRVSEPGPPIAKPRPTGPDGKPVPRPDPRPPKPPNPPEWCFPGATRCPFLPIPYPNF